MRPPTTLAPPRCPRSSARSRASARRSRPSAPSAAGRWRSSRSAPGMSPGAVHKIEKSGMTPTIASLMKIAAALGRSVSFFVEEPATPDVSVIRGDERAKVYTSKQGLDLRNLSGRYGPFLIAGAEAVVEPYADSGPTPMNHPGRGARDRHRGRDGVHGRRRAATSSRRATRSTSARCCRTPGATRASSPPARSGSSSAPPDHGYRARERRPAGRGAGRAWPTRSISSARAARCA